MIAGDILAAMRRMGIAVDDAATGDRLTGGVSSDLWRIDAAAGPICV